MGSAGGSAVAPLGTGRSGTLGAVRWALRRAKPAASNVLGRHGGWQLAAPDRWPCSHTPDGFGKGKHESVEARSLDAGGCLPARTPAAELWVLLPLPAAGGHVPSAERGKNVHVCARGVRALGRGAGQPCESRLTRVSFVTVPGHLRP